MVLPIPCLLPICLIALSLFPSVLTHPLHLLSTLTFHKVQFLAPCSFSSILLPSATFSLIHAFLTTSMLTIPSSIYLFPVLMLLIISLFYLLLSTPSTLGLLAIASQLILPRLNICSLAILNNVQSLIPRLLHSAAITLFQLIVVVIWVLFSIVNFFLKNISPIFAQPLSTIFASFAKSVLRLIKIQP